MPEVVPLSVSSPVSPRQQVGEARTPGPADFADSFTSLAHSDGRGAGGEGALYQRRNFRLGVINGALFRFGDVFVDTDMVLTWFLAQLGTSNLLIGLVSPIRFGGSFLLQMLASGYMQRQPYKLPFYRTISVFRSGALLIFALLVAVVPVTSPWLTLAFFLVLTLFSLGAGLVNIPFMDVVGKVVPPRRRGAFFGQRMFWGGILALAGSSLVALLLAEPNGLHFPLNVSAMFVLAAVLLGLTAWSWILVKEPPSPIEDAESLSAGDGWGQLRRGLSLLKEDPLYRHYAMVRFALLIADWGTPFYIVYARNVLGVPATMVGLYLAVRTIAMILSNLAWGRVSDERGNRRLIIMTTAVGVITPLLVLGLGWIHRTAPGSGPWLSYAFALVFLTAGTYSSGSGIGLINYLLDIAPAEKRPLYLAFNNTLFGLARFLAMASGLIVDWAGYEVLLVIGVVFYCAALVLTRAMAEPRTAAGG